MMFYLDVDQTQTIVGYTETPTDSWPITQSIPTYSPITQKLVWNGSSVVVADDAQKISEYQALPMRLLRQQRNQLLQQTDWRMVSDYPGSNHSEWQTYRQALRDITTQTPSLDENGQLTGIMWPTRPAND
jgi:hypothetical protein